MKLHFQSIFVLFLIVFGGFANGLQPLPDQIELIFLDVGQGDAIVVRSPEGKVALIDAGPGTDIPSVLRQHGIDTIDIAIVSHAHADHIGGMERVLQSMPVRFFLDNGLPHTTATYGSLMRALQSSDITYLEATARTISLGSVSLTILPPPGGDDQNTNSVGVLVEYGEFKVLLTGDSEVGELQYFLLMGVPDVTVLKAAHHGSRNGVTPAWLSATKPEVVVVSVGHGNTYGHPHEWALRYYETVAEQVFRTDIDGEVVVFGDRDGSYSVQTGGGS
jgi:beta-lactamase superfamily II metal-dependent hydrolase